MPGKFQEFLSQPAFFGSAVGVKRTPVGKSFLNWCCGRRMLKVVETTGEKTTLDDFFHPDYVVCDNCGNWFNVPLSWVPV